MNRPFRSGLGVWLAVMATYAHGAARELHPAPQLIVRLTSTATGAVERALGAINETARSAEQAQFHAQAQYPSRARYLVSPRLPDQVRRGLPPSEPEEQLHQWLVLEYPSAKAAAAAQEVMTRNRALFQAVSLDYYDGGFAVVPNDPYYWYSAPPPNTSLPGTSSSQAYALLGLPAAWDHGPGFAYVAHIDNGVSLFHEDLSQNLRLHFSWNSADSTMNVDEPAHSWRGHGTHTAGIITAEAGNGAGTAGICWKCSLIAMRITSVNSSGLLEYTCASAVNAMYQAICSGAQVLSMSLGVTNACAGSYAPVDQVISLAESRHVSIVAAAGNVPDGVSQTHYPARHPYVMSVGGTLSTGAAAGWSVADKTDFAAPGDKILSTFQNGAQWNPWGWAAYPGSSCQSQAAAGVPGYGYCTGTSMATPMIAGSVGLLRSANPLLSDGLTKSYLAASANRYGSSAAQVGAGVPNVGASVQSVLYGGGGNLGLTPLFALTTGGPTPNRFYTSVPQMASAAILFGLKHGSAGHAGTFGYVPASGEAWSVPWYPSFTGTSSTPVAAMNVLTTGKRYGQPTVPLYRFSALDSQGQGIHLYENYPIVPWAPGFVRDGLEGFIYPYLPLAPQPPGTVRLYRRYNPQTNRYALFPEGQLDYFAAQGYTAAVGSGDVLGYVCPHPLPNVGVCPGAASYNLPAVTSANWATFMIGTFNAFTFTATGGPSPSISLSGALPAGVTFTAGTGNATLSGFPAASATGSYTLTITASNAVGSTSQTFVLTVGQLPLFANQGFESPNLASLISRPPLLFMAPDGWIASGTTGLMTSGYLTSLGGPPAPQGAQVGFMAPWSWIAQYQTVTGGGVMLVFKAMARAVDGPQPVTVYVDGVLVASYLVSSTSWGTYSVFLPGLTPGSHAFGFSHPGGDEYYGYLLVDDVRLSWP